MELNIIEDKKTRMVFELVGEDHTFCNVLTKELWNVKGIKIAAYNIEHPLVSNPKIILETDSSMQPKKALKNAVLALEKKNKDFITKFKRIPAK
ncbi:DNA-directed RNA polymerase subunit L [Candidatus Woesearchaeota archaeon]|nr:DNA-directed RNA polymerase subunit L [Candidatus Woesearchaeota archaeon]